MKVHAWSRVDHEPLARSSADIGSTTVLQKKIAGLLDGQATRALSHYPGFDARPVKLKSESLELANARLRDMGTEGRGTLARGLLHCMAHQGENHAAIQSAIESAVAFQKSRPKYADTSLAENMEVALMAVSALMILKTSVKAKLSSEDGKKKWSLRVGTESISDTLITKTVGSFAKSLSGSKVG